jgi:hypothetical protein
LPNLPQPSAGSRSGWSREDPIQGVSRVGFAFTFAAAAYNLVGLPKLLTDERRRTAAMR